MSLICWLPLDGSLRNLGIGNVVATDNNATVDNNGKIGKCYSFNDSNGYIFTNDISIPTTSWSMAAWVYPSKDSSSSHQWIVGMNTSTASDFLGVIAYYKNKFSIRIAGTTYQNSTTSALNNWYHVAVTYSSNTAKLYINGVLSSTFTTVDPVAPTRLYIGCRGVGVGLFTGKVNDVRVYNHTLSTEEVKEISQGLICHCKLDNLNFVDSSGYGNRGTWNGSTAAVLNASSSRNSNSIQVADGLNGYLTIPIYLNKDAVTMSVWLKSTSSATGTGTYHMPFEINGQNYEMSITSGGQLRNGFVISGTRYADTASNASVISDKKWHMITATYDGTTIKRYVDGTLYSTREISGTLSGGAQTIYIGRYGTSPTYGSIDICESDLRLYCTALSADDIKTLYQASEKIDKDGNLYAYEFKENENTNSTFSKNGTIIANTLYDNAYLNDKATIGKRISPNILSGMIEVVTTKNGDLKSVNTLGSISATTMTSMAGKVLCLSYDVCCPGDRYSTEQGQTGYQYVRYGVHGQYKVLKSDGTVKSTTYPFANQLEYSGGKIRVSQYATLPTLSNGETLSTLTFHDQTFDKPATTNNSTWYLRNIKLEICENGSKPTPYIENGAISTQVVGWATGTELKEI